MSEQLLTPAPEQEAFNADAAMAAEAESKTWRQIAASDGSVFRTDIPADIDMYNPETPVPSVKLYDIDKLEPGEYSVLWTKDPEASEPSEVPFSTLRIIETPEGKARVGGWKRVEPGTEHLMEALGFVLAQDEEGRSKVVAVPTPETIKSVAYKFGVDVELLPEDKLIKAEPYVKIFAEGKYPVALGNYENYEHDIEDDHFTAILLGGEPLKRALQEFAKSDIEKGERLEGTALAIDTFTSNLRGVIGEGPIINTKSHDRNSLQRAGQRLGFSAEAVDEILNTAQSNARKLGMHVKET